jgi:hypothetical protein
MALERHDSGMVVRHECRVGRGTMVDQLGRRRRAQRSHLSSVDVGEPLNQVWIPRLRRDHHGR